MENSSSGDQQDRSGQNRQGQRGGRRRQNNRNSGGSGGNSNRRPRNGGNNSGNRQSGGKREYRPSNRGRQVVKKQTFLQKILSFLGLGGDSKSPAPTSDRRRSDDKPKSSDSKRPAEKVEVTSERLYVGNLDYKTTGSDLEKHFSQIGSVKSAEIVINRRTQQSKGFAFVEMSSIEEARKAVSTYHNEDFMGRRMLVNGAKSQGAGGEGGDRRDNSRRRDGSEGREGSDNNRNRRNERGGERNNRSGRPERREEPRRTPKVETPVTVTSSRLKLDNLDYEVGEEELEELFKGIGVVVSTEVISNPDTHQSKGYGFVEMSHIDEAKRAVEILNNKDFMGRKLNLSGAESKAPETSETPDGAETPEATDSSEVAETATNPEASSETPEDNQEKAAPAVES